MEEGVNVGEKCLSERGMPFPGLVQGSVLEGLGSGKLLSLFPSCFSVTVLAAALGAAGSDRPPAGPAWKRRAL